MTTTTTSDATPDVVAATAAPVPSLLSADELQALTLKASYVYEHADRPYFRREVNDVAARLHEQPFLNYFVRYRSDKHDATQHKWSRIRRVVYLSAHDEAMSSSTSNSSGTGVADNNNNNNATTMVLPRQYMLWRNKPIWVALQLVGEERPVYLPMLSAKPPTNEEVMAFCTRQANHNPAEVYTSDAPVVDTTAVFPDVVLPTSPRVYLPTAAQIAKLKRHRLQRLTQHTWTEQEIAEARALHANFAQMSNKSNNNNNNAVDDNDNDNNNSNNSGSRSASGGAVHGVAAAAAVAATLNAQHNLRLEMELEHVTRSGGMLWHASHDATASATTTPTTTTATAQRGDAAAAVVAATPSYDDTSVTTATAMHGHASAFDHGSSSSSHNNSSTSTSLSSTPLLSPFLPRRVQRRVLARYGGSASLATQADGGVDGSSNNNDDNDRGHVATPVGSPLSNASMYSTDVSSAGMASRNVSFSDSLAPYAASSSATSSTTTSTTALSAMLDESTQRWRDMAAKEHAFYRYVSDSQRSAYLNKIADISRRNYLENKRSRLRGIANERRLERKGNLLESSGLWVTDDRERARKAALYKASLDGASDATTATAATAAAGGDVSSQQQQQQQQATTTTVASAAHEDGAWLQAFRARRAQPRLDFGAVPDDVLQLVPDDVLRSNNNNDNDSSTNSEYDNNNNNNDGSDVSSPLQPSTPYRLMRYDVDTPLQRQRLQSQLLYHRVATTVQRLRRRRPRDDDAESGSRDSTSARTVADSGARARDEDTDEHAAQRRRVAE